MNIIILSFNNAFQLKFLLESIDKNLIGKKKIHILYKYDSDVFESEYLQIISDYNNINWIKESNIKNDILEILSKNEEEFVCLFTDNNIIYKEVNINDLLSILKTDNSVLTATLRLGLNTTICKNLNCNNVILPSEKNESFFKWDWSKHYADFGYPFSINGHIFRSKEISKLIKNARFNNQSNFEESLQIYENYPKNIMCALNQSSVIEIIISPEKLKEFKEQKLSFKSFKFDKIDSYLQVLD